MQWFRRAFPALLVLCWSALPSCGSGFTAGSGKHEDGGSGPDASAAGRGGAGGRARSDGGAPSPSGGGGKGAASGAGGRAAGGVPAGGGSAGAPDAAAPSGGSMPGGAEAGVDAPPSPPPIPTDTLRLWLRADRGVAAQDGLVNSWADQSPSGAVAIQGQDDLKPKIVMNGLNGLPSVQFDGADDFLALGPGYSDFSNGLSIFTVAESKTPDACMGIFEASNGSEVNDISVDSDVGKFNYEVQDENYEDVLYPADAAQLFSVVHHTDGKVVIDRNGVFGESVSMMLPEVLLRKNVYIGLTLYQGCTSFNGNISEIIVYARALSDAEVHTVDSYLQSKYACCSPATTSK